VPSASASSRQLPVRIRPLRAGDVEACARIVAADPLWQRYGLTVRRARRTFRQVLAARRRGGGAALVAGDVAVAAAGGAAVGFVWFRREGTFHHSGYVRWLAVAPAARGQGVGSALLRHAEERIFRHGPNVFLTVSAFNRRAQAFYRRLGYVRVGALADYVVPGVTEVLLRKTRGPLAARRRPGRRARARSPGPGAVPSRRR
jgi:ribosomal protein S18 acetylase RimI-like enzyme